ncbi:unnamed protein product [Paramecium pentaurelia]|uniref:Uncharacterized protein n=1 Tax=Paramecium pentaurelia TaxID=43138 RepID=A0A8S1VSN3_9CILI|nr:unnamed protein product [Paramecium pentaurelia]
MSHNFEDRSVNNLLKEIDDLINRMGDQNESYKSDNSFKDQLRQTGRFVVDNEQPCDVPKKFSMSIPKKQNNSQQKKVTIVAEKKSSSSSSSSSDEEYQVNKKKKFKKDQQKQQSKYSPNKAKWNGSQCSYRSKAKSNIKCETQSQLSQLKTQQSQLLVQPVKDVFCLICEEFIPIDIVNIHMTDCQQISNGCDEDQILKLKLENYKKLLSLRFEASSDENVKQLIELLYNCTQQILDVSDQYQLSQIIEDLYVLKTQLNQNTKAYHVLTVAQKIQEIANRKMQVLISEQEKHSEVREISHQNKINFQKQEQFIDRQTVISYATNTTSKKRLFESPSFQHMPKQLVKISSINTKPISQVQIQTKSPVRQDQMNQKNGIEFGNNYDSQKKRSYIQLSNSKNQSKIQTIQNQQENNNRESEPTVISKIQSYISNVKGKFSNENELIKKKFFLQACKCKDKFPVNHPAQNILISEMFNQSQRQQIPENEWEVWICNVLQNA